MKTLNLFIKAITFIPILTGILYITGIVRMDAFLKEFLIDVQFYDVPIDRVLFDGFLNIFLLSTLPVICAMYAAIVLFITSALFKGLVKKSFLQKYFIKLGNFFAKETKTKNDVVENEKVKNSDINHSAIILSNTMIAGFILLGLILIILKASSIGQADAVKLKEKISNKTAQSLCLNVEDKNIKANVLYCGSSFCGFWTDNSPIIIPVSSIKLIHQNTERCITKN